MKYLILFAILFGQLAYADCDMKSSSQLETQHKVGPITNLEKTKTYGKCVVKFDITVNGTTHHLTETETGMEQEESLCYYAKERARKNLLLDLGGTFQTEAVTICQEGTATIKKIKIGDHILETEVGKSKIKKYFTHEGKRCRMFTETDESKDGVSIYNGVICQIEKSDTNWLVVDKW